MAVVLIDYGAGNLHSVEKAFRHEAGKHDIIVSHDTATVRKASHIVLPGVGAFAACMKGLSAIPGMLDVLHEAVQEKQRPFMGICVGMQMMLDHSLEHGRHAGLGWIPGAVEALKPSDSNLKIPHMGWNELTFHQRHPTSHGLESGSHAYFVHSYHASCENENDVLATCDYGGTVTAAIARDNLVGTQFHPEKSKALGLAMIRNFMEM